MNHHAIVEHLFDPSVGLGGIALVFLGLAVSSKESYRSDDDSTLTTSYSWAMGLALAAFVVCIFEAVSTMAYWYHHNNFYWAVLAAFATQILLTLLAALLWAIPAIRK